MSSYTPCSILNARAPMAGSAPTSQSWLIVLHQGAWGERPVETLISENTKHWARARDAQILLARAPKGLDPFPASTFLFSDGDGDLVQGILDPQGLPDLSTTQSSHPRLLICTNGKRDQCCATFGRNLISKLNESLPVEFFGQILECSHIGGHRFAPTAIWLPRNLVMGRLEPQTVTDLLEHGILDSRFIRGDTRLSPPQQVVHAAVWPQEITFLSCEQQDADFHLKALVSGSPESFTVAATPVSTVASCAGEPKSDTWYQIRENA